MSGRDAMTNAMNGAPCGVFVGLVGPSGVGKDSLLAYARDRLSDEAAFVFVRRIVTREAQADAEDHDTLSVAEFDHMAARGAFPLHWAAHNLRYGLPGSLRGDLAAGHTVVANISRKSIPDARAAFPALRIVSVTAPRDVLARRLAARGRESAEEISARLSRNTDRVCGADVTEIDNGGALEAAGDQLVELLRATLAPRPR